MQPPESLRGESHPEQEFHIKQTSQEFLTRRRSPTSLHPLSDNSCLAYMRDLRLFKSFCDGKGAQTLADLKPDHAMQFGEYLRAKGFSYVTLNRIVSVIASYTRDVRERYGLEGLEDFEHEVRRLRVKESSVRIRRYLTRKESDSLLEQSRENRRDTALTHLLLKVGALSSEIAILLRQDLVIDEGVPSRIALGVGGQRRTVVLDDETRQGMSRYLKYLNQAEYQDSEYLFPSSLVGIQSPHLTRQGIWWVIVKKYAEPLNIKINPRMVRNTFVMHYFEGETVIQLALQLGMGLENARRIAKEVGRTLREG